MHSGSPIRTQKQTEELETKSSKNGGPVEVEVVATPATGAPTTKSIVPEVTNKPVIRATPVKKPLSFKSVSINRHFLEKASSGSPGSGPTKSLFSSERGEFLPARSPDQEGEEG